MIAFYYQKGWKTIAPYEKLKKGEKLEADVDWPKPDIRPGWWVKFTDPHDCPEIGTIVGKVEYVIGIEKDGKLRLTYEIRHGYSMPSVKRKQIECRMTEVEE